MNGKDISVVMTSYNGEKYIRKQIESLLQQRLLPKQIVICDDKSTDGTRSILNEYLANDLFHIVFNEEQYGVVKNFQRGCAVVPPGNHVAFCDQDDIWEPQKLERLADEMQLVDDGVTPALIYSDLSVIDREDNLVSRSFWERQQINVDDISFEVLFFGNAITGCTIFANHAMVREFLAMNAKGCLHDEWMALIGYSFGKVRMVREQLVRYRQHESNITYSESYRGPGTFNIISREFAYLTGKIRFLPHQFLLAKQFLASYKMKLNPDQRRRLEDFIRLENQGYLRQRYARYKARTSALTGQTAKK
jgi:glycosyltransferase involved in cell wall biosynthesis